MEEKVAAKKRRFAMAPASQRSLFKRVRALSVVVSFHGLSVLPVGSIKS